MDRIFLSAPDISGRERELVMEAFDSNYVAPSGPMISRFESDMKAYTGFENAVAVASGTAAMHLILTVLGIGKGDEVWTCSGTFIGGVSPIRFVGAEPVFLDSSRVDWTMDCGLVVEQLEQAAKKNQLPAAVISTELYGQSCDLDLLVEACEKHDVILISDSAEALGSLYKGRHAGKGSRAAVLSFNGNKIITTSGGGMVLTDDQTLAKKVLYFATQARQPLYYYQHEDLGYNYRMSNICAAIGVGQLEQIEAKVAQRRSIYDRYCSHFSNRPGFTMIPDIADRRSTRWLSCVLLDPAVTGTSSSEIIQVCEEKNIEIRPMWKPMHLQPIFQDCRFVGEGFCTTLFENGLCLPSGSGMSAMEQDRVIQTILDCVS